MVQAHSAGLDAAIRIIRSRGIVFSRYVDPLFPDKIEPRGADARGEGAYNASN
jgi:hypothetical protein